MFPHMWDFNRCVFDCLLHAAGFTEAPWPCGAGVFPGSFAGAGSSQTFCERIPNFARRLPLHLAVLSHFLHISSRIGLEIIPSSGWSGGGWRRYPQPGRILAKAWYSLLNMQRKRAAATVVQLKLLTTHGIQYFNQWHNFHNLPPPPPGEN
jgi:hypothetical protein